VKFPAIPRISSLIFGPRINRSTIFWLLWMIGAVYDAVLLTHNTADFLGVPDLRLTD